MYSAVKINKRTKKRNWTSKLIIIVIIVASTTIGIAFTLQPSGDDSRLEGTELVFAFMIFRHGDRTPEAWMDFSQYGDVDAIKALIEPWGYGQLTNAGIKTAYKTGQFIRRRYKNFIPRKYNASEVYIRSTDFTRTKMTVLTAMAAVFPPTADSWSKDVNWVPVPYTTVPVKYDYMLGYPSCPTWVKRVHEVVNAPAKFPEYEDTIEKTARILNNKDLTVMPVKMFYVNDLYTSLISMGFDVGKDVRAMIPDIAAAAARGWDLLFSEDVMVELEAGVLLQEFFTHADKIISGNSTQKVRIYGGHDINLFSLEAALQVTERQGIPKYGSLLSLELRRVVASGQYIVVPVYLPDPHEGVEKYLEVQNCGVPCDYDSLYKISKKYLLDEKTWRIKCNFTEDSVVTVS